MIPLNLKTSEAGVTTRSKVRDSEAALSHECIYVNFLYEIEPKKVFEALEEEGWVILMQEEVNQFERNKAWTLVPAHYGKTIIRTKWIFSNKMDENVARLEAIKIFLAYAVYMGFVVYQMDVKSSFLNGKLSEEVYVQQPPGLESSEFPNHVCKLDKALYGLKQALRAWGLCTKLTPRIPPYSCKKNFQVPERNSKSRSLSAKKQSLVAMSSTEAEYVVAVGCYAQVLWIKSQLADYDVLYDKVPIFCDNTSPIAISINPVLHSKTKHIDIRYHFIRDHILKGDIELHFVPTDLQLADIFTKSLAEPSFTELVAELGKGYKNEKLTTFKPHHISAASFKTPSASKVALTSYILKVANISIEPEQTLILPSKEVNAGNTADKSSFETAVISKTKETVADTQHVEDSVATADTTNSLDASESVEELRNRLEANDATKFGRNGMKTQDLVLQYVETASESTLTQLKVTSDDVTMTYDAVTVTDSKEAFGASGFLTTL
ncbi:retrovirus-related pol polyprotein from transposon TNT 1-94 [Tanacetum coccineum]